MPAFLWHVEYIGLNTVAYILGLLSIAKEWACEGKRFGQICSQNITSLKKKPNWDSACLQVPAAFRSASWRNSNSYQILTSEASTFSQEMTAPTINVSTFGRGHIIIAIVEGD